LSFVFHQRSASFFTMISEPALDRLSAMFRGPDVTGTRYELVSVLGRGGMGVVYLARDVALDREVALKIVDRPGDERAGGASPRALENEARILARLEHPGIVPVHDFGELPDGRLFYAMKRVRGSRLDHWAVSGCGLHERLGVFLRVCDAVAFAHAHGVVHRDLKPANVMVGEFGEVLVLDWGVAKQAGARDLFAAGAGTPAYMAPEQAHDGATIDERTDVFALGALLEGIAGAAAPVLAIARKARSTKPSARYQTVQGLEAEVSRFIAGRAVEAHRERLLDRVARVARRHRVPILLVATYLVVRILLLWLMRV
jgi:serine/threonine protein kinase